jgi:hypothetical protein
MLPLHLKGVEQHDGAAACLGHLRCRRGRKSSGGVTQLAVGLGESLQVLVRNMRRRSEGRQSERRLVVLRRVLGSGRSDKTGP